MDVSSADGAIGDALEIDRLLLPAVTVTTAHKGTVSCFPDASLSASVQQHHGSQGYFLCK